MNTFHNKIVTICGSARFSETIKRIIEYLESNKAIVFSLTNHTKDQLDDLDREVLDEIHKRKISRSDCIFVVDENGYIGESTRNEIAYAESLQKPIYYLSELII